MSATSTSIAIYVYIYIYTHTRCVLYINSRFIEEVPGEITSLYGQGAVLRQRNDSVPDVVIFALSFRNLLQEVGGVQFGAVDLHPASF